MSTKTHSNPASAHVNRDEETSSPRLFFVGMGLFLTAIVKALLG